jgi:CMP-N,N'-diacetyllegionaminic acid synthase
LKLLALIPARGGSKGVPGKNIRLLGGKPLIWYSFEAARISGLFSEIVLTTDDPKIAQVGHEIGCMVPFIRPSGLASDSARTIDVVNHALSFLEIMGQVYEGVVLLQPTSPFRKNNLIGEAIDKLEKNKADSVVSVRKVPHHYNPHWVFEESSDHLLRIATGDSQLISRRQDLPDAYYRDGQIYITRTEIIKNCNSFIGDRLTFLLNEGPGPAINIDTEADWQAAEQYLTHHPFSED